MSGYLNCVECNGKFKKLYEDPRTPPLDEGPCMCWNCTDSAFDEVVETAQEELDEVAEQHTIHMSIKVRW